MATTTTDVIEGATVNSGKDGITVTRVAQVVGLVGDPAQVLVNALTAPNIPQRGEPHPTVPDIQADTIDVIPNGKGQARVTITYRRIGGPTLPPNDNEEPLISVGASAQPVQRNLDKAKDPIEVTANIQVTDDNGVQTLQEKTQSALVTVQEPQAIIQWQRRERTSPLQKALEFVGKVNNRTFNGTPQATWLCMRINGESDDGGKSYIVTYEFHFREESWDAFVTFIDPDTGAPLTKKQRAVAGFKFESLFEVYELADFERLNLYAR